MHGSDAYPFNAWHATGCYAIAFEVINIAGTRRCANVIVEVNAITGLLEVLHCECLMSGQ